MFRNERVAADTRDLNLSTSVLTACHSCFKWRAGFGLGWSSIPGQEMSTALYKVWMLRFIESLAAGHKKRNKSVVSSYLRPGLCTVHTNSFVILLDDTQRWKFGRHDPEHCQPLEQLLPLCRLTDLRGLAPVIREYV